MNYEEAKNYLYNGNGECGGNSEKIMNDLYFAVTDNDIQKGISNIKELTYCDDQTAKLIWCDLKMDYGTIENNPILQAREQYKTEQSHEKINVPKCPVCNSTNLTKITTTKKVVKMAAFGIFGMGDNGKTWRCNNCGSKF